MLGKGAEGLPKEAAEAFGACGKEVRGVLEGGRLLSGLSFKVEGRSSMLSFLTPGPSLALSALSPQTNPLPNPPPLLMPPQGPLIVTWGERQPDPSPDYLFAIFPEPKAAEAMTFVAEARAKVGGEPKGGGGGWKAGGRARGGRGGGGGGGGGGVVLGLQSGFFVPIGGGKGGFGWGPWTSLEALFLFGIPQSLLLLLLLLSSHHPTSLLLHRASRCSAATRWPSPLT
jgi:hypothetical protein